MLLYSSRVHGSIAPHFLILGMLLHSALVTAAEFETNVPNETLGGHLSSATMGEELHAASEPNHGAGLVASKRTPDFRFVITGGLAGGRFGSEGFFESEVFRQQNDLPVRITNGELRAWRSDEGVFFTKDSTLSETQFLNQLSQTSNRESVQALFGPDLIGLVVSGTEQATATYATLQRTLSAVKLPAALEVRQLGDMIVYGFDPTPETPLQWPTQAEEITSTSAVNSTIGSSATDVIEGFLLARHKGGLDQVLGIVDERLAQKTPTPALYLDVGGTLASADTGVEANRLLNLLNSRAPAVLGVGRAELEARLHEPEILSKGPYVSPIASKKLNMDGGTPKSTKLVEYKEKKVLFVGLGGLDHHAKSWLGPGETGLSLAETLEQAAVVANDAKPDLILGIALSDQAATSALSSTLLDGVLHLASSKLSALPAFDDIDFQYNHSSKLHPGPGLIRVSYADVTEVEFWLNPQKRLSRTRIHRIPIIDASSSSEDAAAFLAELRTLRAKAKSFPARVRINDASSVWTQEELDHVAGGMVRSYYSSEISILPRASQPTPTDGDIPKELVAAWLPRTASLVNCSISGANLQQIGTQIETLGGDQKFVVTGANLKAGRVGGRSISKLETYDVTLPLSLARLLRAAKVPLPIEEAEMKRSRKFDEILVSYLNHQDLPSLIIGWLDRPEGPPLQTVYLDVSDVDLALSFTEVQGTEPLSGIRDARVQTPRNHTIGINGGLHLVYDGPFVVSKAGVTSQFSRTVLEIPDTAPAIQEARDQLVFDGDLRVPVSRLLETNTFWLPNPNMRLTYQTEWTPSQTTKADGSVVDNKRRAELRGLIGAGWDLAAWLPESRLGLFIEHDFADTNDNSRGWGAEAEVKAMWTMGLFSLSLKSLYRGYVPNPAKDNASDIGTILQNVGAVSVPAFHGLSLSLFADSYFLWGRIPETRGPASSLIVGAALTYSGRGKWQPFRNFEPLR